jgi:Zn-dependent protease/CBS domain-containing protein
MFGTGKRFQIAKIRGIPIYASWSWLIIAGLFAFSWFGNFAQAIPATEAAELAALIVLLFFGAILLHEGAHAVAARGFDLPVRGITLVFWGGATETRSWRKGPLADFVVAGAGPATTAVIGLGFLALAQRMDPGPMRSAIHYLSYVNLLLAKVNAAPGFPLDGGRMLTAVAWAITGDRALAQRVTAVSSYIVGGALIVIAFQTFETSGFALFYGLVGFAILSAARQLPARAALREQLARGTAVNAMRPITVTIPASTTVLDATERWLRASRNTAFPVTDDGRVVGTISLDDAANTAASRPVRDAMVALGEPPTVGADEPLDDAVEWIANREALVVDPTGRTVGLIDVRDVDQWLQTHWATGRYVEQPVVVVPPRPDQ